MAMSTPREGAVSFILTAIVLGGAFSPLVGFAGVDTASAAAGTISVPGDYATIQAAVDNASPGATIEVENGTYSEVLSIGKDLTLTNAPGASPIIAFPGGNPIQKAIVISNSNANVEVSGFTIQGDPSKHGVGSYSSSTLTVRNVRIEDADYGIEATTSSEPLVVENVEVHNVTMGALVEGSGTLQATELDVNDTAAHGVAVRSGGTATIRASSIRNASLSGLYVFDSATVDVENTSVESPGEDTVYSLNAQVNVSSGQFDGPVRYNASTGTIADATVTADFTESGVHVLNGSTVEIRDSTITSSNAAGVVSGVGSTVDLFDSDIDAASYAVHDHSGGDLTAEHNTLDSTVFAGGSGNVDVNDNEIVAGGTHAIHVDGRSPATVYYNEIRSGPFGPVDYGIYVNGTGAAVAYNTINATGQDAIHLEDADVTVTFNDLSNTSLDERTLHPGSRVTAAITAEGTSRVEVRENDIDDAYGSGIRIDLDAGVTGTSMRITENDINRTGTDGIFVLGPSGNPPVEIRNNTVAGVGATNATGGAYADGITLVGSADGEVINNTIVDADTSGVSVSVPGPVPIRGNTILGSGSNGIEVRSGSTNVTDNYVRGGLDGIDIGSQARTNVTDNVVADAGAAVRIDLNGWVERLQYNDLSGGQSYAIYNYNQTAVDAPLNYYGPNGVADASFDGSVTNTEPFLTKPPSETDRNDLQSFGYNLRFQAGKIYTFGTPAPLERNLSATFTDFQGVVYRYDASSQSWQQATGDETLGTMDAVILVPETDAAATVDFVDETPPRPTERQLSTGWHFIAPRFYGSLEPALAPPDNVGVSDVVQALETPANQPAQSGTSFGRYAPSSTGADGPRVSPFAGYYVYVNDGGTIPGTVLSGVSISDVNSQLNVTSS